MSTKSVALCACLAIMLSACAKEPTTYVVDTFCSSPASKKRTWNPETDTVEHMREAVTWNSYVDRRCGIPGKGAA